MAKYNFENLMYGNGEFRKEFEDYMHDILGKNTEVVDFDTEEDKRDKVATVDAYASYYMFRSEKGDLSEEDMDKIDSMMSSTAQNNPDKYKQDLDAYAHAYWGRNYDDLPLDRQFFTKAAYTLSTNTGVTAEDIAKKHEEDLAREIEEEEKAKAAQKTEEKDNQETEVQTKFNNKDAIYEDFLRLADNQYGEAPKEEIEEFIRNKNAYIAAHPEEKDEIESHLEATLNSKDDQIYGSDVYQISDSFREQYKALSDLMGVQSLENDSLTIGMLSNDDENNRDNTDDRDNGGNGGGQENDQEEDLRRVRSAESDMNAYQLDILSYDILRSMNKIDEMKPEELSNQDQLYQAVQQAIGKLDDKENAEFNDKFIDVVATNEQVLEGVPPSTLAKAYVSFTTKAAEKNLEIENTDDEEKKQQLIAERDEILAKKGNVAKRIDDLTDMLIADTHEDKDLFFMDDTNVADVYDGYKEMFTVRSDDLRSQQDEDNPNPAITSQIQQMAAGQEALDEQYGSYLDTYGLKDVTKDSAEDLDKRYDKMAEGLAKVELNDETASQVITQTEAGQDVTLGALLSSVKFYDAEGNVQPQFKDKDGNETTEWSPGAKVIEGSKLEQTIAMAKQLYVQENLTSKEELTSEDMQKALTEYVPQVLYAANVKSLIEKNVLETPDQYKDRETIDKNIDEFVKQLAQDDKTMVVTEAAFTSTKNSIVNQAYAYRGVLAKQLGVAKDDAIEKTPILQKVCNNIKPLDARPESRDVKAVTPNVWKSYASETLQGMAAAAIGTARVKGAQLCAIGVAHAVTGIATANLMLAASTIIPAAVTIKQIYSWRKEQKAQGKPTGFKAMMKDKNMRWTLATTALTEAAVVCAFLPIPGARIASAALGGAALAIGVGRAAGNDYKKLRAAGKSKIKAGLAAGIGAALKVGTAFLVNKGMTSLFQNYFGEHQTTKHHEGQKEKSHTEIRETQEMVDGAKKTLDNFYKGNPEALQHDLDQVREQLHAMGRDDISPEVFLRNACDAGMNTGVDTVNHIDGGGMVHTHGNNLVMTDSWAQQHNIDPNDVHALGSIRGADGAITITDDALKGFDAVKMNVSVSNEVGSTLNPLSGDRLSGHQDGVLGRQATVNESGTTVHSDDNATEFNTYADGKSGYIDVKVIDQEEIKPYDEQVTEKVNYDGPFAAGMIGIRNGGWIHKMAERAGSLLDKIVGHKKKKQVPVPIPTPTPTPTPKKKYIPPEMDVKNLLNDEYKIVYGIEPTPVAEIAYKKLVMEELKADREAGKTKADNLVDYITERKATYDEALATTIDPLAETKGYHETKKGKEATAQARQDMFQTNLSFNGQDLPRNHMTLQKFTKFVTFALSNGADRGRVTAAHDNSTGRSQNDGYHERPSGGRFDVGTGKVAGQTSNKGRGIKDGKPGSMPNPKKRGSMGE